MKRFLILFSILRLTYYPAQTLFHTTYNWEKNPTLYIPPANEERQDLILVSQKKIIEIGYDSDGQAMTYETSHNIYHVNTAKGVDQVNKGYVPLSNVLEEVQLRARCITAGNKVVAYNSSTVRQVDDLDGNGPYKIFAVSGVEINSDVEILYTLKKSFTDHAYYFVQGSIPVVHYEAHLISPKNLVYEVKTYNGLTPFQSETSDTTKNHHVLLEKNLKAGKDERYASEKPNYKGYAYQLVFNTARQQARLYTWDIISRNFYTDLFGDEKSITKGVEKILSKSKITKTLPVEEKIKLLDRYIKTNYEINDSYSSLEFTKAIETKKLGYNNGIRFYIIALKHLDVAFELVLTTRRDELKFDGKFPSFLYTKDYLLYFPETKQYLTPLSIFSRPGMPDPDMMHNEGLFIKELNLGGISGSSAKIKKIGANDFTKSFHKTNVKVTLDLDQIKTNLEVTQSLGGYSGYYVQPVYRYMTQEQKDDITKSYYLVPTTKNVQDLQILNTLEEDLFVKPFQVKYKATHDEFLENAGKKFVFKVGQMIGPQVEMYAEEARSAPADVYFTHLLERSIEVNIPAGYKPTNLQDLDKEVYCKIKGETAASFKSSYVIKESSIIITVYEDYREIEYPLEDFESFRSVINAAADFNKKNIVFEKI